MKVTEKNILFQIYSSQQTVFRLIDIAMMTGEDDLVSLSKKMNYYAKTGKINNPRKGIYAKKNYRKNELGCRLYTPSYLSLYYVLQREGVIFQYSEMITLVSYLSRNVNVDNVTYQYRKVRNDILIDKRGIISENGINKATPERALLDLLYLGDDIIPDNPGSLDTDKLFDLLDVYNSPGLEKKITKLISHD
ncbi:MAG: hypothetical protein ACLFM1_11795 [Bacteroidales bacterium]